MVASLGAAFEPGRRVARRGALPLRQSNFVTAARDTIPPADLPRSAATGSTWRHGWRLAPDAHHPTAGGLASVRLEPMTQPARRVPALQP